MLLLLLLFVVPDETVGLDELVILLIGGLAEFMLEVGYGFGLGYC